MLLFSYQNWSFRFTHLCTENREISKLEDLMHYYELKMFTTRALPNSNGLTEWNWQKYKFKCSISRVANLGSAKGMKLVHGVKKCKRKCTPVRSKHIGQGIWKAVRFKSIKFTAKNQLVWGNSSFMTKKHSATK